MPILNLHKSHPLADGRQSEKAMLIRRGIQHFFMQSDIACVCELPLSNGRRADIVGLTKKGDIYIIEIKSSLADLRVDHKWHEYRSFCDQLYFASDKGVPIDEFPQDCGFFLADSFGAEELRSAPTHRLQAPARKAMTLKIARHAAKQLMFAEIEGIQINKIDESL